MLVSTLRAESSLIYLNRILENAGENTQKSSQRLAGGTHLLPDNPANYAIYTKLETHIREFETLITNQTDMISFYRTADGYLAHITELLLHIRELLLRRSGFLFSDQDGDIIKTEVDLYYDEILSTLNRATFNKKSIFKTLLDDETLKNRLSDEAFYTISNIDRLMSFFTNQRSFYGTLTKKLEDQTKELSLHTVEQEGFQGTIWDIDIELETGRYVRNHLLFLVNLLLL